jgi:hypothetical protein
MYNFAHDWRLVEINGFAEWARRIDIYESGNTHRICMHHMNEQTPLKCATERFTISLLGTSIFLPLTSRRN